MEYSRVERESVSVRVKVRVVMLLSQRGKRKKNHQESASGIGAAMKASEAGFGKRASELCSCGLVTARAQDSHPTKRIRVSAGETLIELDCICDLHGALLLKKFGDHDL